MKSILKLLFAILIASSSAFFILNENAEIVEAKTCKIGEFPLLQPDGKTTVCKNSTENSADNSGEKVDGIKGYILSFTKVLIVFSASISTLMIAYAGYLYTTSEGNYMKTEQAKQALFRAGIGVLVLAVSFTIMNLLTTTSGFFN